MIGWWIDPARDQDSDLIVYDKVHSNEDNQLSAIEDSLHLIKKQYQNKMNMLWLYKEQTNKVQESEVYCKATAYGFPKVGESDLPAKQPINKQCPIKLKYILAQSALLQHIGTWNILELLAYE